MFAIKLSVGRLYFCMSCKQGIDCSGLCFQNWRARGLENREGGSLQNKQYTPYMFNKDILTCLLLELKTNMCTAC